MSDYKVGDKIYYFESRCSKFAKVEDLHVYKAECIDIDSEGLPYFCFGYIDEDDIYYKSKNEAINAMVKHLVGMFE